MIQLRVIRCRLFRGSQLRWCSFFRGVPAPASFLVWCPPLGHSFDLALARVVRAWVFLVPIGLVVVACLLLGVGRLGGGGHYSCTVSCHPRLVAPFTCEDIVDVFTVQSHSLDAYFPVDVYLIRSIHRVRFPRRLGGGVVQN